MPVNRVFADDITINDIIDELTSSLFNEEINQYLNEALTDIDAGETLGDKVKNFINGDLSFNYNDFFTVILANVFSEIKKLFPTMLTLCLIALFYAIVSSLNPSFVEDGIGKVLHFACFLAFIVVLFAQVYSLILSCCDIIKNCSKHMQIILPMMLMVMTATGASGAAGVFKPAVTFLSVGITGIFNNIILPLTVFLFILSFVSGLSCSINLEKYKNIICSIIKWILGIVTTVFAVFMSIQGMAGSAYDGVFVRLSKYAIGNSVPIVGGFLSGGVDLVVAGGVLVKNSIGLLGIVLLITVISPIFNVIIYTIFLKLTAAIIEPFSSVALSNFINTVAKNFNYLIASVLVVAFMYILTVIVLINTGGVFI